MLPMTLDPTQLPDDIATLKAMVIAAERKASYRGLEIEALKLTIAKLQRNTFGASSESGKKLLDQLELQLAELEEGMAEDKASAAIYGASVVVILPHLATCWAGWRRSPRNRRMSAAFEV